MTRRTLFTAILGLVLVLAMATTGSATVWTATNGVGVEYTKTSPTWTSEAVTLTGSNNVFALDFHVVGSWDGRSDPNTRLTDTSAGRATWDWLTINVYKAGSAISPYRSFVFDDIDNGGNQTPRLVGSTIHYETLLPNAGTYYFQAVGHMTIDRGNEAETWVLDSARVNPTPIPAAIWLLGGGLLGLGGLRRIRNNA